MSFQLLLQRILVLSRRQYGEERDSNDAAYVNVFLLCNILYTCKCEHTCTLCCLVTVSHVSLVVDRVSMYNHVRHTAPLPNMVMLSFLAIHSSCFCLSFVLFTFTQTRHGAYTSAYIVFRSSSGVMD